LPAPNEGLGVGGSGSGLGAGDKLPARAAPLAEAESLADVTLTGDDLCF
jgi:hypothetical protein